MQSTVLSQMYNLGCPSVSQRLVQGPWMSTNKGVSIGISVAVLVVLLIFVVFWINKIYKIFAWVTRRSHYV
ncbi:hypothetical protein AB1E18_005382 [Capra hircus]